MVDLAQGCKQSDMCWTSGAEHIVFDEFMAWKHFEYFHHA